MRSKNYRKMALALNETKFIKSFDQWCCRQFNLTTDELGEWLVNQHYTRIVHLTESFAREFRRA